MQNKHAVSRSVGRAVARSVGARAEEGGEGEGVGQHDGDATARRESVLLWRTRLSRSQRGFEKANFGGVI